MYVVGPPSTCYAPSTRCTMGRSHLGRGLQPKSGLYSPYSRLFLLSPSYSAYSLCNMNCKCGIERHILQNGTRSTSRLLASCLYIVSFAHTTPQCMQGSIFHSPSRGFFSPFPLSRFYWFTNCLLFSLARSETSGDTLSPLGVYEL